VVRRPAQVVTADGDESPSTRGGDGGSAAGTGRLLAGALADIVRGLRETLTADLAEPSTGRSRDAPPGNGAESLLAEVLADILGVEQVPVDAHVFDDLGADSMVMARFCARVRKRAELPSVSMKDVYRYPTIRSLATALVDAAPTAVENPVEGGFAQVLAEVMGVERVPVDAHVFDGLGADSMVMARFCARVRRRPDLPPVSMKDVYRHPTIACLARALADAAPSLTAPPVAASIEVTAPAGTPQYVLCGALQLLAFVGYSCLAALVITQGYEWISGGAGPIDVYLRSVAFGSAAFLGMCALPILAKWLLIGRWKPQQIRIWSLAYVRFWFVRTLVRSNPLVLFVGSPLHVLYLRALGARIGRGVVILSRNLPVCTDLLTIGDGTVVRKDCAFPCYRAHAGLIQTGPVSLGKDVIVGEATVIDIETSLGDGAQLGHSSSLHAGQSVPDGERWHGSPAQPTEVDYGTVEPAACGALRRAVYSVMQLLNLLAVHLPLAIAGVGALLAVVPRVDAQLQPGAVDFSRWTFYRDVLALSFVLLAGAVLAGLLFVATVPRALNLAITPGRVYRLYGLHYAIHRAIARLTNVRFFTALLGDSSYIVHYLRCIGYDLSHVEQTGSNFGMVVKHDNPYLCSVGRGTMVADGLSIINADFSSTSFRVSRTTIGPHSFLGNRLAYPPQGRTGDDCLIGTKAMVPVDGEVREGVGLLGSPGFEIPRSVERDRRFDHLRRGDERRRRLAAKNMYNLRTIGLVLLMRWIHLSGIAMLAMAMAALYRRVGVEAVAMEVLLAPLVTMAYFILIERGVARFQALRPRFCSIYHPDFWWHERYWKCLLPEYLARMHSGTPFKNVISRLLGVRLGRRVFDDGCFIPERTLVTVGDDCTLNAETELQAHSQEDGTFKSDRITVGAGCTLGVGAFVHYGVTMGDGAVLAAGCFLMKGEEVPPQARWGGNPAVEMRAGHAASRAARRRPGVGAGEGAATANGGWTRWRS
jgi:non-ribosomal peptide synthetase-like protein